MTDPTRLALVALAVLAPLVSAAPASATFPGQNGKLAFQNTQTFTVNPDGSALTAITPPRGLNAGQPAYSPDGSLIAFDYGGGTTPTGWGIWDMTSTGADPRQITQESQTVAGNDTTPAWSPDGAQIAFVRNSDLYVMNADGSGVTNLTSAFAIGVLEPEWSPRGDLIAFSAGADIYVMGPTGAPAPQRLTFAVGNQNYPSWSPDGSAIAYAFLGGVGRVNADGSNEVVLASNLREVWDVAWSPDGTRIAFINDPATNPQVQEELYMMNADGTGVAPVGVDTSIDLDWGVPSPPSSPPPTPEPTLGETAVARTVSGTVLVGIPSTGARAAQKGVTFVPLEQAREIPIGSFLDTTKGTVALSTARDRAGREQAGRFTAGLFQVLQSRKTSAKGLTELRMKGSTAGFRSCRTENARARSSRLSRRTIRRLRGNARGRYRTRGRHSAATVRGTVWTVQDRCDGTLTSVKRGKVAVRDFRRRKTILVGAGKSYLASP